MGPQLSPFSPGALADISGSKNNPGREPNGQLISQGIIWLSPVWLVYLSARNVNVFLLKGKEKG